MWLPVAAGGEKEIKSALPNTGDSKGGGKKGLHQLKHCKELWTERTHRSSVLSTSHRKKQEREPAKTTIAMVIYSIGHTQQGEEIKATFPAAQNILEIGSGPRIHPAQLLVDAVICLLILHAVCRSKRTQHQIQM